MVNKAIKELIYKMADDQLIIGHRNSEWTGIGPIIEEDIAFSSMAQDKVGHAWNMYQILNNHLQEDIPDKLAFTREAKDFKCCQLVEYPIGGYDYSLVRHFFHDYAELCRFEMLADSSFEPLAKLAKRIKGEIKYHILHADTWMNQLVHGTDESRARMQASVNEVYPIAFSIFEPGDFEQILIDERVFPGEAKLEEVWLNRISEKLNMWGYQIPQISDKTIAYGGRKGNHTGHLTTLLQEMTEVNSADSTAKW